MLNRAETRFKADGRQTVDTRQIILPVQMRIQRSDAVQALAEARRIVDQLRRMAEEAELPNARLAVPDLDADKGPASRRDAGAGPGS